MENKYIYNVVVQFTEDKVCDVEASSPQEAKEIVENKICSGDWDDFEDVIDSLDEEIVEIREEDKEDSICLSCFNLETDCKCR